MTSPATDVTRRPGFPGRALLRPVGRRLRPGASASSQAGEPGQPGPPGQQARRLRWSRRRRAIVAAILTVVLVAGLLAGGWLWYRAHNVHRKLLSTAVALTGDDRLVNVPEGSPVSTLIRGSRVVRDSPGARARAREQQQWLRSGTIPGASVPQFQPMVSDALLDLDTLTTRSGASLASGPTIWRYVWPRDAAFSAAAFAVTGHQKDAVQILQWMQRLDAPDGIFQARYLPDGSGPPDARGIQTDGTGWLLWAISVTLEQTPQQQRPAVLHRLDDLITRTQAAALRLTDGPGAMPTASQDYWEVTDSRLSLGTVAPLALGLESAAQIETMRGSPSTARVLTERAATLRQSITTQFGAHGYPRYLGGEHSDTSLTFLLPPFATTADPAVARAWADTAPEMTRPAGGLAPGEGWKNDGISWTPETALAALAAAGTGDRATAVRRLQWLHDHRTPLGALPEKVLSSGDAAGPAPLAWTAALVVLTAHELDLQASKPASG